MTTPTTDRVLYALFCLSRDTCFIDATEIARAAGVSTTEAAEALLALERDGWVDATRARLTLRGLAKAVQLSAAACPDAARPAPLALRKAEPAAGPGTVAARLPPARARRRPPVAAA